MACCGFGEYSGSVGDIASVKCPRAYNREARFSIYTDGGPQIGSALSVFDLHGPTRYHRGIRQAQLSGI